MKKFKVSHKEFSEIFTKREFTKRDILSRNIFLVESGGYFFIEERMSWIARTLGITTLPFVAVLLMLWAGAREVPELISDSVKYMIFDKPLRKDELYAGQESTNKLIKLAGWNI